MTHRAVSSFQAERSTASSETCSQLKPPRVKSCFIVCSQSVRGRPCLRSPCGGIQWTAALTILFGSIRITCPVHRNLLSLMTSSNFPCWLRTHCHLVFPCDTQELAKPSVVCCFQFLGCRLFYWPCFGVIATRQGSRLSASNSLTLTLMEIFLLAHILPNRQMHCWLCPVVSAFICRCQRHCLMVLPR